MNSSFVIRSRDLPVVEIPVGEAVGPNEGCGRG
jgi:hypothetical protein